MRSLFINVNPLLNPVYTGIPQLTWHVVRRFLAEEEDSVRFFIGSVEIERPYIERLVQARTGLFLSALRKEVLRAVKPLKPADLEDSIGLFPHAREFRQKIFHKEICVFHDLTGILTPEFHNADVIQAESQRFVSDLHQADRIICVSNASRDDVIHYGGVDKNRIIVAYPGVEWFPEHEKVYKQLTKATFDPYVLIFGTFEPRKNIELIFQYILQNPKIVERFVFCFCGSEGWGGIYERCRSYPGIEQFVRAGRIRFVPFVNERLKFALMKEASFLIYPSFLEGFGSPVAESLSLGVPVVVSIGGSLPEVAGECGYYFHPDSTRSLSSAIHRLIEDLKTDSAEVRLAAIRQGLKFQWSKFCDAIASAVESVERE